MTKVIYTGVSNLEVTLAVREIETMVQLTRSESALVEDVMECIRDAIEQSPEMDLKYANKTKIQKLVYYAIDEFDLPITYSWYLAGAVVPDSSIGPDMLSESAPGLDTGPEMSTRHPSTEVETNEAESDSSEDTVDPVLFGTGTTEPAGPTDDLGSLSDYVSREELIAYYRSVAPTIWHEETMRFLQNFYQEKSPEQYRLLYIESTHLRTHLAEVAETIKSHLEDESPVRSLPQTRKSIELSVSDFHYYLRQTDNLRETFQKVVRGTDLLEEAIIGLESIHEEDLRSEHLDCVEMLQDFFFYNIWKDPCLRISAETATGPQAAQLRTDQIERYEAFDQVLDDSYTELAATLDEAGILPDHEMTHTVDDDALAETLTDLSSEYLG